MGKLIEDTNFVDEFLAMMKTPSAEQSNKVTSNLSSGLRGRVTDDMLNVVTRGIVVNLRKPNDLLAATQGIWVDVFAGDSSYHGTDTSAADFALVGHFKARGLNANEIELAMRASGRYRPKWDERRGSITWLEYIINRAGVHTKGAEPDSFGDVHNARVFALSNTGRMIFNATRRQWLRWCDHDNRWQLCGLGEEIEAAKATAQMLVDKAKQALATGQEASGKALMKHAIRTHDKPRLEAMLSLATSESGMSVRQVDLDKQKHLLGVKNGVVNLQTGKLLVNTPDLLITKYCPVNFDPDAEGKRWPDFLAQIMLDDDLTIKTLQRNLGCALSGQTLEELLFIWYGWGANGKSVLANIFRYILGDYAVTAPASLLTARRQGDTGPRNDLAALAGARLVLINELGSDEALDEQTVKYIAGREPISARFLHKEYFEFEPTFTPILRTNHKPIIRGSDDGIWRRIVLIPFRQTFTGAQCNPHIEEQLRDESEAILAWMVQGAVDWFNEGVYLSPTVKREVAEYRNDSDVLGQFLEEKCFLSDPNAEVTQRKMYEAWQNWSETNGHYKTTKNTFTRRLKERGIGERKTGADRYYTGIELRPWGK